MKKVCKGCKTKFFAVRKTQRYCGSWRNKEGCSWEHRLESARKYVSTQREVLKKKIQTLEKRLEALEANSPKKK